MAQLPTAERRVVVRGVARPRPDPRRAPRPPSPPPQDPVPETAPAANPAIEAARRAGESLVVAIVGSTGLYLVGSVYTDAFYGRLSIEVTSLDLPPPYVALQSIHALRGLLEYPSTLLLFWVLYRTFAGPARRLGGWFGRARRRFPRLLTILANVVVIAPLVVGAFVISFREQELAPRSVLSEVAELLGSAGVILFAYAVWLGWSQRRSLVAEVRARKPLPLALVFVVYLLTALASTAAAAEVGAESLLTGASDGSLRVVFTPKPGTLADVVGKDLILVTARGGAYYVVEQEPSPPSQRPTAYVVPFGAVDAARVQRLNDANATIVNFVIDEAE